MRIGRLEIHTYFGKYGYSEWMVDNNSSTFFVSLGRVDIIWLKQLFDSVECEVCGVFVTRRIR